MKNPLSLLLGIFIFMVVGCSYFGADEKRMAAEPDAPKNATTGNAAPAPKQAGPEDDTRGPSLAKFNKLEEGMSYKEAAAIMGGPGKKVKSAKKSKARAKAVSYEWKGANFETIICVFQNDKLYAKTKANLK